jgi:hypothetical protein
LLSGCFPLVPGLRVFYHRVFLLGGRGENFKKNFVEGGKV